MHLPAAVLDLEVAVVAERSRPISAELEALTRLGLFEKSTLASHCDRQAFEVLRKLSQDSNVPLVQVATELISKAVNS